MSDETLGIEQEMLNSGWTKEPGEGFIALIGPIWRAPGAVGRFRFIPSDKHRNRNGVVHGGMMMALGDRAMGVTARGEDVDSKFATVHLAYDFLAPAEIGQAIDVTCQVVRGTGKLRFIRAEFIQGSQIIGVASGIWKRL